jgi:hypothetical protein
VIPEDKVLFNLIEQLTSVVELVANLPFMLTGDFAYILEKHNAIKNPEHHGGCSVHGDNGQRNRTFIIPLNMGRSPGLLRDDRFPRLITALFCS